MPRAFSGVNRSGMRPGRCARRSGRVWGDAAAARRPEGRLRKDARPLLSFLPSSPEYPSHISVNDSNQPLQIIGRSSIGILVPTEIPVTAIKRPFSALRAISELGHRRFCPNTFVEIALPFLNKGKAVSAEPESQSHLVPDVKRNFSLAIGVKIFLGAFLDQGRKSHV